MFLKKFVAGVVLATMASSVMANDRLPVGDCVIQLERLECAIFTIRPNYSMAYVMGDCQNGQITNLKYRARTIERNDRLITIDHQYHIFVKSIDEAARKVRVRWEYKEESGALRRGDTTLTCY